MGDFVRPTMDGRLQRILNNTAKLERMQNRELQKEMRNQMLMEVKKATMPLVEPDLEKIVDAKCGRCNGDKEKFLDHKDWFLPEVDALTMEAEAKTWKESLEVMIFRKFLSMSMKSLVFHPAQINMLKKLERENVPVMFLLQSENFSVDAMLVKFVMKMNKLELPVAFVDKKFREIWMVGKILEGMKMKFGDESGEIDAGDVVKQQNLLVKFENLKKLLKVERIETIDEILEEDFFEHENPPKPETFYSKLPHNTHLLPITINYEKLSIESSFKWCSPDNIGNVKLNFHEPYTVVDILKTNRMLNLSSSDVKAIDDHLKYDIAMKRPVMASNVVAFLLLTKFRHGATAENLAVELNQLRNDHRNIDFGFEGKSIHIVELGVELLRDDLKEMCGKFVPENFENLSKYSKVLMPHFAFESIVVIAGLQLRRIERYIDYDALLTSAVDLCNLLQISIHFSKPCEDFSTQIAKAFDRLQQKELVMKPSSENYTENEMRARRIARYYEDDSDSDCNDDGYQSRNPMKEVTIADHPEVHQFKAVVFPVLESYLTVACILKESLGHKVSVDDFLSLSLKAMREECEDGNCKTWESCSIPWMKNCLECFEMLGKIEIIDNSIALTHDYDTKQLMKSLINRIGKFFDYYQK